MSQQEKLTRDQLSLLSLIKRSAPQADGSYHVSNVVWPLVDGAFPVELVVVEKTETGGTLRLTELGQAVSNYSIGPRP